MEPIGKRFFFEMVANRRSGLTNPFSCGAPKTTAGHLLLVPRSQQSVYNQKNKEISRFGIFCILLRNSLRLSSILSSSIKFTKRFSDPLRTAFSVGCLSWSPTKTLQKTCPPKKTHLQKATMCRRWHSIYYLRTWSPSLRCPPLLWPLRRFPSDWVPSSYIIVFTWYKPMLFWVTIILQGWPQIGRGTDRDW